MYETQKHYSQGLHVLRGLAAVSIVLFHASVLSPASSVGSLAFVYDLQAGVTLFFALSGYTLVLSNAAAVGEAGWLRAYTLRRIFRIVPLWWFMVGVSATWSGFKFSASEISLQVIPLFTFVPGRHMSIVGSGWTVGVEMLFYTAFPLLLSVLRMRAIPWTIATGAASLVSLAFPHVLPPELSIGHFEYTGFPRQLPVFLIGSLFAVATHQTPEKSRERLRLVAGLLATALLVWWISAPVHLRGDGLLFKATTMGMLIAACASAKSILYNRVTKFFGDVSYSLYLAHSIVVYETKPAYEFLSAVLGNTETAFLAYALLVLAISAVAAAILHQLIEEPAYRYGRALARRST